MRIKYKNRQGELALNLSALMPCTIQDFKRVLSFLDLSEDLENHTRELYDFMQTEMNVLHTILEVQPEDRKTVEKLKMNAI